MLGGLLAIFVAGGTIDCSRVVSPIDTPPIRSPLAVHTAVARRISGKRLVEIGTRNGDGMDCFARVSSKATAVEMSVPYCKRLRRRARALRASGTGDFKVVCQAYQNATPADADIITWWQQAPHLQNEEVLLRLRAMQQQGLLRSSAQAIVIFDEGWPNDMKSFARLRPEATWVERVPFDERALCFGMLNGTQSFSETCERAFGAFMVLGIPLGSTAGALPAVGEPDRQTQTRCSSLSKTKIRIAACFFGLSRNLAATLPSIQSNLLAPLKATANGFVDVFVHALLRSSLTNLRSGEFDVPLNMEDFLTLSPCRFTAEDQDAVDQEISFESLARSWLSAAASSSCNRVGCFLDVGSKINALHALYSLQKVAQLVQSYERSAHIEYTHVVAARPDTSFLSPLPLSEVALPRMRGVRIPNTHQWAGINDRFAWGEARAMLDVYMRQYAQISNRGWRNATSTEHFLCLHLAEAHVPLGVTRVCVVRTRAGGQLKLDDQAPKWVGAPYPNYRSCLRTAIDEPKITDYILDRPGDSTPPCASNPVTTSSSECTGGDCSTRDKARQRRSTARVIDIFSYGGAHYDRTLELRYHELYDVVDLFVVLEIGSSASHNPEFIREHRPRLKFDPHLFDKRFRNKTLHVKLDGSLVHSSEPVKNLRMMLTHGFASAYRRARGWRGHPVGEDGISNDLLLLSDIDEIPRSRVLRGLLEQSAVWSRLEAGEVYALNGPCYYYNLECRAVAGTKESNWDLGPKLVHGDTFLRTGWSELRLPNVVARRVSDASWRFGYLMTLDEMRTKLCLNLDIAVRHACASFSTLNRLAIAAATCANPFGRKDVPLAVYPFLYEELPTHATYLPNRERFLRPGGDMYQQLAVLTGKRERVDGKPERIDQRGASSSAWFAAVAFAVLLCNCITRGRFLQSARQLAAGYSELGLRLAGIGS